MRKSVGLDVLTGVVVLASFFESAAIPERPRCPTVRRDGRWGVPVLAVVL
jgi:hypothetical protein